MTNKYFKNTAKKLMYRVVSPTEMMVLQILGRDSSKPFCHRHERVVFPDAEHANQELAGLEEATESEWSQLVLEYLAVNKEKLEKMNNARQRAYDAGTLKL